MKFGRKWSSFSCFIIICSFIFSFITIETKANPLNFNRESFGVIVSSNDNDLQMIEANVLMEINETYGNEGDFKIVFDGNYTIFNPNVTTTTLIGAPFQSEYKDLSDTITAEVDNSPVEFDIISSNQHPLSYLRYIWRPYFEDISEYFYIERCFVITNVTFPGFSNTSLRYRFSSFVSYDTGDGIEIAYDVGSARSWNNETTEFVEFRIYGSQPRHYSNRTDDNYHNFTLSEINGGRSYLWSWEQTIIQDYFVGVNFSPDDIFSPVEFFLTPSLIILSCFLTWKYHKKSRNPCRIRKN